MTISTSERVEAIRRAARDVGFDACRIARADAPAHARERLEAFLKAGRHGDMAWMATRKDERASPKGLWPDARAVVMLGVNYGPDTNPLEILAHPERGAISVYAQNKDYHDVVKKKLKALARTIVDLTGCELKVFVDTAPVMEKPLAAACGLGWQGKHTNLVSRDFGSWLFLGAIFLDIDLPADDAEEDHCGRCRACLDICPTGAFPAPYQLDARRCISYLTIEHKGPIPHALRALMGNRIYGCDDCLAVCPWNKFASAARETKLRARDDLRAPHLADLATLDDAGFRSLFSGSPIKRIGRDRFVRNVLIAIGNAGDDALAGVCETLLEDASALVRGAAVWALARLTSREAVQRRYAAFAGRERDPSVHEEWRLALTGAAEKSGTS